MTASVYFSIDIEASGPVPGLYNMVSLGAVPVTLHGDTWRAAPDRFYLEFRPIAPGFDSGAMAVHGIPRERLEAEGVPADEGMRRLTGFVNGCVAGGRARAVFVGHNAVFDWSFVSYYYAVHQLDNPFGYKGLDIKSLAMGRLGIDWFDTSKENLAELLPGLPDQDRDLVHRADYDALYQAEILCALLNRLPPIGAGSLARE